MTMNIPHKHEPPYACLQVLYCTVRIKVGNILQIQIRVRY